MTRAHALSLDSTREYLSLFLRPWARVLHRKKKYEAPRAAAALAAGLVKRRRRACCRGSSRGRLDDDSTRRRKRERPCCCSSASRGVQVRALFSYHRASLERDCVLLSPSTRSCRKVAARCCRESERGKTNATDALAFRRRKRFFLFALSSHQRSRAREALSLFLLGTRLEKRLLSIKAKISD